MSHPSDAVRVNVTIQYSGKKASHFQPNSSHIPVDILLDDLDELKCPHPKRSLISVPNVGTVHFYWITTSSSPLVKTLMKLKSSNLGYKTTKDKLSIQNISVRQSDENSHHPPYVPIYYTPRQITPIRGEPTPSSPTSLLDRMGDIAHPNRRTSISSSRPSSRVPSPPPMSSAVAVPIRIKIEEEIRSIASTSHSDPSRPPKRSRSPEATVGVRPVQRARLDDPYNDKSEVESRLDKLNEIRQNMEELRSKESELMAALKAMDPNLELGPSDSDIQVRLGEEKRLRRQAEEALEDVRRECKHPFVVPQIFDAFLQISKLTTKAMS